MKRAVIAGVILLSCVFSIVLLSKRLKEYAYELVDLATIIHESADNPEKSAFAYSELRSGWCEKELLFVLLSGRISAAPIEESINNVGNAIGAKDADEIKKESTALISKFIELGERNSLTLENLV